MTKYDKSRPDLLLVEGQGEAFVTDVLWLSRMGTKVLYVDDSGEQVEGRPGDLRAARKRARTPSTPMNIGSKSQTGVFNGKKVQRNPSPYLPEGMEWSWQMKFMLKTNPLLRNLTEEEKVQALTKFWGEQRIQKWSVWKAAPRMVSDEFVKEAIQERSYAGFAAWKGREISSMLVQMVEKHVAEEYPTLNDNERMERRKGFLNLMNPAAEEVITKDMTNYVWSNKGFAHNWNSRQERIDDIEDVKRMNRLMHNE